MNTLLYFVVCAIAGGIYFCIGEYRYQRRRARTAEASLAQADTYTAQLLKQIEDMEEQEEDDAVDYSIMATMIESHTTELADIHTWMDAHEKHMALHCQHLSVIDNYITQPFQVQLIPSTQQTVGDYTGPDECDNDIDPYPEPIALPEWAQQAINDVEGLDAL